MSWWWSGASQDPTLESRKYLLPQLLGMLQEDSPQLLVLCRNSFDWREPPGPRARLIFREAVKKAGFQRSGSLKLFWDTSEGLSQLGVGQGLPWDCIAAHIILFHPPFFSLPSPSLLIPSPTLHVNPGAFLINLLPTNFLGTPLTLRWF